jgi:hypothetical protein
MEKLGEIKMHTRFCLENLKIRDHLRYTGLRGTECEGIDWIQMVKNRVEWRAFMSTTMSFRDRPMYKYGIS